ncbi:hypothetical protein DLH72_01915 [Candidatus Gracilibacteria bacterium]|nr:MAG: hypothetical protein DLH72_01915 [Candidatus Gracilibacteria bacterium]
MDTQVILQFILAIGLGLLIGFERGIGKQEKTEEEIRTFALISFLGALTTYISMESNSSIFAIIGFIVVSVFAFMFYGYGIIKNNENGLTTELALVTTFLLGVFVMSGYYQMAVILSILITLLLSSKKFFMNLTKKISMEELQNTIKFAVIALVILPMLPNQKYSIMDLLNFAGFEGKFDNTILNLDFFNPYGIWSFCLYYFFTILTIERNFSSFFFKLFSFLKFFYIY